MCHLTERKPKPLCLRTSVQKEEPAFVAPATEALSLFCQNPLQKRKLSDLDKDSLPKSKFPKFVSTTVHAAHQKNQEKTIIDAARSGNLSALQNFVSAGCDVNERDAILGNSALHFAVFGNHLSFVQRLLGCDDVQVDIVNHNGSSPLLCAVDYGHSALVRLLVQHNAAIDMADKQGFTALHKAVLTGNLEILRFLLNHSTKSINAISEQHLTPLHQAAFHGKRSAMKILLQFGAHVSPVTCSGATPLHMATLKNQPKAIKLLLDHGASVNVQDHHERTPLHYACLFGHLDAASVLCENECSVHIKDFKNQSPLELAAGGLGDLLQVLLPRVNQT